MTIEEIRKNAPKGATHYDDYDNEITYYAKDHEHHWQVWNDIGEPFDPYWDSCLWDFQESLVKPLY